MNIGNLIVFFTFVWILVFFIALPIGVETDDNVQSGNDRGAPKFHNMKKKTLISLLISLFITLSFYYLMENGYLDFIQVRPD